MMLSIPTCSAVDAPLCHLERAGAIAEAEPAPSLSEGKDQREADFFSLFQTAWLRADTRALASAEPRARWGWQTWRAPKIDSLGELITPPLLLAEAPGPDARPARCGITTG